MKIERQLQGTLNAVFTELIKERGLEKRISPFVTQEEGRADITLKNSSGKPLLFIELKDPTAKDGKTVFDGAVLFREIKRAQQLGIRYFGNCNFLACAFFDSDKIYDKAAVQEGGFTLKEIARLGVNYAPNREIETKLRSIANFYLERALEILDRKPITFSNVDELFIFKIRKLIQVYGDGITDKVWEKYDKNKQFKKEIQRYSQSQLWNNPTTYDEIENLTHIALLMLISKLIFYKAYVDNQTWHSLSPMKVGANINTPDALETAIWNYFETFKEITGNFELLIGERADIIFQIPFVSDSAVELVKEVLETGGHYNFSDIPFDIIGRIFEELIREDERHKLGQYFTPPHVIDFINSFAINKSGDKVFDPSCGSGTFLVRAYERKKELYRQEDKGIKHEILLNEIYGNDLSGYPAYLSMLNLAIRNTRQASYPRIINKDFFAITSQTFVRIHNNNGVEERKTLPKFDAIVGNPPYTRQEDIGAMQGTKNKDQIQKLIKSECGFEPSQRTSIYAYFFYHAAVFLKEGGYLTYIVQNSWLDTDYGIDLQHYLLENFEIVAIMDSEVERFFPTASVNTSIVILRKQSDASKRKNTHVKFVYYSKPLSEIIKAYKGVDNLRNAILKTNHSVTNEYYKLNCINQHNLEKHTKWGQFLKAPQVYFDILKKGKDKWTVLSELAVVKFGIKTGCNEFFILKDITDEANVMHLKAVVNNIDGIDLIKTVKLNKLRIVENGFNELWLIDSQFLKPMLTSPKDVNKYKVEPKELPYSILLINEEKKILRKEYPYTYRYIAYAERKEINQRSSISKKSNWFDLGEKMVSNISFNYIIGDFGKSFLVNAYSVNNFHNIYTKKKAKSIWYFMNSTISWLIQQLIMRANLGDGAGKIETYELADFPIMDIDLEKLNVDLGETRNFKQELGTLESLETVNPERVKLDSAILEAISYKNKKERDAVLIDLYRATYQLINARQQKAQSMKGLKEQRSKVEYGVYVEQLKTVLIEEKAIAKNTIAFAKYIEGLVKQITSENRLQKKILDTYWREKFGEGLNEKAILDKTQTKMF